MEQLEFLGDAVLGLVVSDLLVAARPDATEGELTRCRAALVNTKALAAKAQQLGLDRLVVLGKGEEKGGGRDKPRILAAVLEAVLGAVFLDGGYGPAKELVVRIYGQDPSRGLTLKEQDPKTSLQELTQRLFRCLPEYEVVGVEGPEHARDFRVQVSIQGTVWGRGSGRSKRRAAEAAAREALERLSARAAS